MNIEINPIENRLFEWHTDLTRIAIRLSNVSGATADELGGIAEQMELFLDGYKSKRMEPPDTYTVTGPAK